MTGQQKFGATLDAGRHAVVLACAAAGLWALEHGVALSLPARFAATGGLYALVLVLSLRLRPRLAPTLVFILGAVVLNLCTERLGMQLASKPGSGGRLLALLLPGALGAAGLALLLRWLWMARLGALRISALATACALATALAGLAVGHLGRDALWCLSMVWWSTFSALLCWFDQHPARAARQVR